PTHDLATLFVQRRRLLDTNFRSAHHPATHAIHIHTPLHNLVSYHKTPGPSFSLKLFFLPYLTLPPRPPRIAKEISYHPFFIVLVFGVFASYVPHTPLPTFLQTHCPPLRSKEEKTPVACGQFPLISYLNQAPVSYFVFLLYKFPLQTIYHLPQNFKP
ncbi:hypothetical protein L873DRAFT_1734810, partial [Choiromyces venosus 120613-1]